MRKIIIIGSSNNRDKFGNKAVRAFIDEGWEVYPVNPNESEIEGIKCYHSVFDIKDQVEMVSIYLPANVGLKVMEDLAKIGVKTVILNPGTSSSEIIELAEKLGLEIKKTCSIRMIGKDPNDYK